MIIARANQGELMDTAENLAPQRIVLTTFGSFGDLHPFIAVGLGLKARGHLVALATSAAYRTKIEALGLEFRAVRPDQPDWEADPELIKRLMDLRKGPDAVVRGLVVPALRDSYADTLAAAEGADLLISHSLTFTTRLVAEQKKIRWASVLLQPLVFFSAYDPPVLAPAPIISKLRFFGPSFYGLLFRLMRLTVRGWTEPVRRLRSELGLPPAPDPLFEGQHSPALVLALFSELLGPRQPDWPANVKVTGFAFFDRDGEPGLEPELERFLASGPPPIVFTLGSTAVLDAGAFYEHSVAAAKKLNRRAVLLLGKNAGNRLDSLPEGVAAFAYAPFSELFPKAAAIVHQGGVGTTGHAMRAGRPMLVMPYAHDQPDNAERVARLGIGRTLARNRYNPATAAAHLQCLLENPSYSARAAEVGKQVQRENGVQVACDALENLIRTSPGSGSSK